MTVHYSKWRNQEILFRGDTLSFWCFTPEGIPAEELSLIYLQEVHGIGTPPVAWGKLAGGLPAEQWRQVKFALARLRQPHEVVASTKEEDLSRFKTICFAQAAHDGKPHAIYLDEIKIFDSNPADKQPPARPLGLTATGPTILTSACAGRPALSRTCCPTKSIAPLTAKTFSRLAFRKSGMQPLNWFPPRV